MFIEDAIEVLNSYAPEWRDYLSAVEDETLCIPDCLDLGDEPEREKLDNERHRLPTDPKADGYDANKANPARTAGDKGEDKFLSTFRQMKIGGILLGGFHSNNLYRQLKHKGQPLPWNKKDEQKPDFIFFHKRYGVLLVEVKGIDEENYAGNEIGKKQALDGKLEEADTQIAKRKVYMPKIFEDLLTRVIRTDNHLFNMNYAISLPFFNVVDDINLNEMNADLIFTKSTFIQREQFLQSIYKAEILSEQEDAFEKLIAGLIYSSKSVVEISGMLNAMAVHRQIDRGLYLDDPISKADKKEKKDERRSEKLGETFFLNKRQLDTLNWHKDPEKSKIQIISGIPGTGKTLILIMQALRAIKKKRPKGGKIVIQVPEKLRPKIELIFHLNNKSEESPSEFSKGVLIFLSDEDFANQGIKAVSDNDDLFMDEMTLSDNILKEVLDARREAIGCTTVIITGYHMPTDVGKFEDRLKEIGYAPSLCILRTVVRGTIKIIEEWQEKFASYEYFIGHSITGAEVIKKIFESETEILEFIRKETKKHVNQLGDAEAKNSNLIGPHWKPHKLAIIAESEKSAAKIRIFLKEKGVQCDLINSEAIALLDANQKVTVLNKVVVCHAMETPSHEWPCVITVFLDRTEHHEPYFLLARSRAIAKLITVERRFAGLQKEIDILFRERQSGSSLKWDELKGFICIKMVDRSESYTEKDLINSVCEALIRHNHIDPTLRKEVDCFKTCYTLMNCFETMAHDDELISAIAHKCITVDDLRPGWVKILTAFSSGMWSLSENKAPLFLHIYWDNLQASNSEEIILDRWKIICKVLKKLIEFNPTANEAYGEDLDELSVHRLIEVIQFILYACIGSCS